RSLLGVLAPSLLVAVGLVTVRPVTVGLVTVGLVACSAEEPEKPPAAIDKKPAKPAAASKPHEEPKAERRYLLERVGDVAVVQLYADGFEELSLKDKLLCYHLSNAAVAGREIFIDQKFDYNLQLREVLETLYLHRDKMDPAVAREIERYTKLFWLHNGIHNSHSTRKELLKLDQDQFGAAVLVAQQSGARLPGFKKMVYLYGVMADPNTYTSCTNKSPGDGKDPLRYSCNNLYGEYVTQAEADAFDEQHPLNSRLAKNHVGALEEEIYRAGDGDKIPPGRYAVRLTEINKHLTLALPHAPARTRAALEHLIRYYKTGAVADWRAYNIAWVVDRESVVDTINGFIEVYLDARGAKGAWEAVVSFLNPEAAREIQQIAREAQWFEDRMPWRDEFKKPNVTGINARAITVIMETGDSGPMSPLGINLPNEAEIRETYGSKSVNLANVVEAYAQVGSGSALKEFAWDEAEIARAKKYGAKTANTMTNLHEVVGHASGKIRPEIKNPRQILGTYYSTLEEARADLVGLYWLPDKKLQQMGIVPNEAAALARYEAYCRNILLQLRRVPMGAKLEQDHMRNRQMVVHWLIDNSDAVKVVKRAGKTYYRVQGVAKFRAGCARLLAAVMGIKATGDFKAGKSLVDTYGTKVDRALHQEVLARLEPLNIPSAIGFVQPELRLVEDPSGEIVDVHVHYPLSLEDQMLRWSGRK
ncbi:MAG: dipeptidyl-peptidase 3 family protein, partial [Planctomycetota bacterium]